MDRSNGVIGQRGGYPQRLMYYLLELLDEGHPQIYWMDSKKKSFAIEWKHQSRNDHQVLPGDLFRGWSLYKGHPGDNQSTSKTRVCRALHSMRGVKEIPSAFITKGIYARRVYNIEDALHLVREYEAAMTLSQFRELDIVFKPPCENH